MLSRRLCAANTSAVQASALQRSQRDCGETSQHRVSSRRVRPLPSWLRLESRPIPAPGAVAEWTLTFAPQSVGPQVVLLEADFDDSQPSFADLTVRVEATATR